MFAFLYIKYFQEKVRRIIQQAVPVTKVPGVPNMHTFSLLLLFALMGASALAHPTYDNNDNSTKGALEKRSSRPWLESFDTDDTSCKTDDDGNRPFIVAGSCQAFQPYELRVGGSWGAGTYGLSSFTAYENDDCTGAVKAVIKRKGKENGFCFNLHSLGCQDGDVDNPCFWNGVRGNK